MIDQGIGCRASEANLPAVSLRVAPMSKGERLHRWADALELQMRLAKFDDVVPAADDVSPLSIAFEDWAFQAEGLRGGGVDDALAFFDLSASEIRRILGPTTRSQAPAMSTAAERVRSLAQQAEALAGSHIGELEDEETVSRPARRDTARLSATMGGRRRNGTAAVATASS